MQLFAHSVKPIILKNHLGLIFLIFLGIGIYNLDDYGVAWDEEAQRDIAVYNYCYIFEDNPALKTFYAKEYGPAFELTLLLVEKLLGIEDSRSMYLLRHFLSHLFFLIGALFCAKLVNKLYRKSYLAVFSFLFVVLLPRFYEDSFVNTKDLPFMSMFFICFYLIQNAFEKMKVRHFILLGIAIGITISIRIMGVMLFAGVIFFLLFDLFRTKDYVKLSTLLFVFILTAIFSIYISFPHLWAAPVQNFKSALVNMSKFTWYQTNLFMGKFIRSTELSWNYIPGWFGITVPLLYLLTGLAGTILLIYNLATKLKFYFLDNLNRNTIYYLACFLAPIITVVLLKSVLYDTWRHLYFIYAPFVLLSIYGLHKLDQTKFKPLVLILVPCYFLFIAYTMIKMHPFQNVYFNELMDKQSNNHLLTNYEMDYWGVSYRQSLDYVLANDTAKKIKISAENDPCIYNSYILEKHKRERLRFTDIDSSDYFLTNYRWHPQGYPEYGSPIHNIRVFNNSINGVYKIEKK